MSTESCPVDLSTPAVKLLELLHEQSVFHYHFTSELQIYPILQTRVSLPLEQHLALHPFPAFFGESRAAPPPPLLQQLDLALTRSSPPPLPPRHPRGAQSTGVTVVGAAQAPPPALQHPVAPPFAVAQGSSADSAGMSITTTAERSGSTGTLGF